MTEDIRKLSVSPAVIYIMHLGGNGYACFSHKQTKLNIILH